MERTDVQNWTDEELCQVYDLQHGYDEVLLDFVRYGKQEEVHELMTLLPQLYGYKGYDPYFFPSKDISPETAAEWKLDKNYQDYDFIYRNPVDEYKTADTLREVFEDTFQNELGLAHPEILALMGGKFSKAADHYDRESFDNIRASLPYEFKLEMSDLLEQFPADIQEKAMKTQIYGYTSGIYRNGFTIHVNNNEKDFERFERVTEREPGDTVVAAYDLQMRLTQAAPKLEGKTLTEAVQKYRYDPEHIRRLYGSKFFRELKDTPDEVLVMASQVDFVHTEERLPVLENHKICLYGTEEQKIALYLKERCLDVSNTDAKALQSVLADHYEQEGFAKRYVPMKGDPLHYADKTFKVLGRSVPDAREFMPHWEIDLGDGKPVHASADEIIPSAMPELQRKLYLPDPTPRKLEDAVLLPEERKSITRREAEGKLTNLLKEFQQNGVKANGIMELLHNAGQKLQTQGRV